MYNPIVLMLYLYSNAIELLAINKNKQTPINTSNTSYTNIYLFVTISHLYIY